MTSSRRTPPRADVLLAVGMAAAGMLLATLSTFAGAMWGLQGPLPLALTASVLLAVPLVWRRRAPMTVAAAQALVYAVAVELGAMEPYASQIMMFLGFYSIGAWSLHRTRAHWARVIIVIAMFLWFTSSAIRGFFDSRTEEFGTNAFFAVLGIQIAINIGYWAGAWVFGDRAWASRLEREALERAHAEIQAQQGQLADQAVTLERVRIARELHDVVAHHVSAMGIQAGAARRVLGSDPERATASLKQVEQSARDAIGELRTMVLALRSDDETDAPAPGLDDLDALLDAARETGQRVTLQVIGEPREVSPAASLTMYRVVQEALTNARKHAGPVAHVEVRLRYLADAVEAEIADDGHGSGTGGGTGMGLTGMRERVAALGGSVEAGARSRGGWLVRARVPVSRAADAVGDVAEAAHPRWSRSPAAPGESRPGASGLEARAPAGPAPRPSEGAATPAAEAASQAEPDAMGEVAVAPQLRRSRGSAAPGLSRPAARDLDEPPAPIRPATTATPATPEENP